MAVTSKPQSHFLSAAQEHIISAVSLQPMEQTAAFELVILTMKLLRPPLPLLARPAQLKASVCGRVAYGQKMAMPESRC
ncbi:hypothetical protein BaRGS_00013027 [Batillaria attramentaria]|uniref:Uncharacterized protein n=1 Tax=Batillaria attramentaria TaxID=370345 RepID=A0ABD0L9H8_9CAEN